MTEQIKAGLERLGRFSRKEKSTRTEAPQYIPDDYDLLYRINPYLHSLMNRSSFQCLQVSLRESKIEGTEVVDIGASSNFLRGTVFLNATRTIAIDPAYRLYDRNHHKAFVGKTERQEMEELLQYACRNLQIPARMNQNGATQITGEREGKRRSFELLPEDANTWLLNQKPQTIANFVVCRVFPSPSAWGKIISSLRDEGILITTGYGKQYDDSWREEKLRYDPDITQGGGMNIENSPLPSNGNSGILGLTSIAQFDRTLYFYRKNHHLEPVDISQAIINNQ